MPISDSRLKRPGLDLTEHRLTPSGVDLGPGLELQAVAGDRLVSYNPGARAEPGVDSAGLWPGGASCQQRPPSPSPSDSTATPTLGKVTLDSLSVALQRRG